MLTSDVTDIIYQRDTMYDLMQENNSKHNIIHLYPSLSLYMYIYIYIYIYIYMHPLILIMATHCTAYSTYTCTHTFTYVYIYICMYSIRDRSKASMFLATDPIQYEWASKTKVFPACSTIVTRHSTGYGHTRNDCAKGYVCLVVHSWKQVI